MRVHAIFILWSLLLVSGCSSTPTVHRQAPDDPIRPLQVYVVNYPLQYFAERIGGDRVEVHFPAPADVDPAFWSPDAETIAAYQQADVILLNGAGYADWVTRAALPDSVLVDTSAAFADRLVPVEKAVTHSHGPEGEHVHGEVAFTTWLDPTLAIEQARGRRRRPRARAAKACDRVRRGLRRAGGGADRAGRAAAVGGEDARIHTAALLPPRLPICGATLQAQRSITPLGTRPGA